jgi:hypothetical protein
MYYKTTDGDSESYGETDGPLPEGAVEITEAKFKTAIDKLLAGADKATKDVHGKRAADAAAVYADPTSPEARLILARLLDPSFQAGDD